MLAHEATITSALTPTECPDELVEKVPAKGKRPCLPGYVSPSIEIIYYPERPNLFDAFSVSGRAWGSELQGAFVYVTVAGVTRRARIIDGLWEVFFEDDSLPKHYSGSKELVAQFRDNLGHVAQATLTVYVDDFIDSFITVDEMHKVEGAGSDAVLQVAGELNLGTHLEGRELSVLLVCDEDEQCIVAAGALAPGWQHGEWRARIPLAGVMNGAFRVRAQLTDTANAALTRVMTSAQAILL